MFKMYRKKCGLCGGKLGEGSGIMQYLANNSDGVPELFSMTICKECADDFDKNQSSMKTEEVHEFRDWLLRK